MNLKVTRSRGCDGLCYHCAKEDGVVLKRVIGKDLLYSAGNSTQNSVITYMRKESEHIYIYDSLCCTSETNTTNTKSTVCVCVCSVAQSCLTLCGPIDCTSHSSTLAWKLLWTQEPGRLQSMGLQRVGHD